LKDLVVKGVELLGDGVPAIIPLSASWGGLKTRISSLGSILKWEIVTAPKLDTVAVT
jgi:hypothetical protein